MCTVPRESFGGIKTSEKVRNLVKLQQIVTGVRFNGLPK